VDIIFAVCGQVVVDYQGDLLNINSSGQQIGGDQNSGTSASELLHDDISLRLIHISMHGADGEILLRQFVGQPIDLSARVAKDDGLSDCDSFVQIGEGVEFPIFFFDGNVELFDTFEGEFVFLDEDANGIAHEFLGDFEDIRGHGSGEKDGLSRSWEELENIVNLILETSLQVD